MSKIPKILVVDDDPDIVEILRYNLSLGGYDVKSAFNGKEAIKKAKIFLPEIILLDVMMPEMDGIEACSLIKEIPSLVNTRIIFLSARSEDYTQLSAFDAGADDYISKPVKPKILLKKIESIFKRINKDISFVYLSALKSHEKDNAQTKNEKFNYNYILLNNDYKYVEIKDLFKIFFNCFLERRNLINEAKKKKNLDEKKLFLLAANFSFSSGSIINLIRYHAIFKIINKIIYKFIYCA